MLGSRDCAATGISTAVLALQPKQVGLEGGEVGIPGSQEGRHSGSSSGRGRIPLLLSHPAAA